MNTRKIATEYRLAQWTKLLQARNATGQSIQEFCEAEGISRNRYFYWQRKVREVACTEVLRRETALPRGWAEVAVAASSAQQAEIHIEVGGCRITATGKTDMALLARICQALQSKC